VLNKGCGQLADSLRFIREQQGIVVQNQRGHKFDLAGDGRAAIPILLYSSGPTLPERVEAKKHHISKRAGFVHVMHIRDYYHLCHTLALPKELVLYFEFRQDSLLRNPYRCPNEANLTAQFIAETDDPLPDGEVLRILESAKADVSSFDISFVLDRFGEKVMYLENSGAERDYYDILEEFTRLNRSEMRAFKKLFVWAVKNAGATKPPARLHSLNTGTGFVIFPVPQGMFEKRLNALRNFSLFMKYDFGLERQIGVSVARDGEDFEIDWMFIEHPWQQDSEIEKILANKNPFLQKPAPKIAYRYPA
jgi:hypothetical protein